MARYRHLGHPACGDRGGTERTVFFALGGHGGWADADRYQGRYRTGFPANCGRDRYPDSHAVARGERDRQYSGATGDNADGFGAADRVRFTAGVRRSWQVVRERFVAYDQRCKRNLHMPGEVPRRSTEDGQVHVHASVRGREWQGMEMEGQPLRSTGELIPKRASTGPPESGPRLGLRSFWLLIFY